MNRKTTERPGMAMAKRARKAPATATRPVPDTGDAAPRKPLPAGSKAPPKAPDTGAETPRKSDMTRQMILDAAARVFRIEGYSSARLTDIAALIGMKAGSL